MVKHDWLERWFHLLFEPPFRGTWFCNKCSFEWPFVALSYMDNVILLALANHLLEQHMVEQPYDQLAAVDQCEHATRVLVDLVGLTWTCADCGAALPAG